MYGGEMTTNDIVMLEGGPLIDAAALESALGWTLKPEGLPSPHCSIGQLLTTRSPTSLPSAHPAKFAAPPSTI
jgi:hypothetical protein